MKTFTFNSLNRLISTKIVLLFFFIFAYATTFAQLQNNGTLHVSDNSFVYLASGNYGFGTGTQVTETTRTQTTFGKLIFASGTTSSGATSTHFIDGYARTLGTSAFVMYLGQSGTLAPAKIQASDATGVDAAFYLANPTTVGAGGNALPLKDISSEGYWDIMRSATGTANAKISLSFREATYADFSSTIYTIAGYSIANSKWEEIPSTADATYFLDGSTAITPSAGTITSTEDVDLSNYRYFTIASKGTTTTCADLVTAGETKTWTGTAWSPAGAPTEVNPVVLTGAYPSTEGSFTCYSLALGANDVSLANGQFIDCVDGVTGTGKIILASEASFVQRYDSGAKPNIELNKVTPLKKTFDYIYWGTPIEGNFISQLEGAKASTGESAQALESYHSYTSGPGSGSGWTPLTAITTGKGFITSVKKQLPFLGPGLGSDVINLKLTGVANNGDVDVSVLANNDSQPERNNNLLANPYPSAIDAELFLDDNKDIDGAVYIWTSNTPYPGSGDYLKSDYIVYTRLGVTVPSEIAKTFDGKIASGQGFKVRALRNGSVKFTNCMRLTQNNTSFYKNNSVANTATTIDRFKLNMTGDNGVFSQILIGYTPETTIGYDRMYDATPLSASATAKIFSVLDNTDIKLAINARPSFVNTDAVSLGITKNNINAETFTISLTEQEGIFATSSATVYIHDKVNNTYHNLSATGSFSFTTDRASLTERFEVVYQTSALDTNTFDTTNAVALYVKNNELVINAPIGVSNVHVFDITGKLIKTYKSNNETALSIPFNFAEGVYIAKIQLNDNTISSQKLINVR